MTQLQLNHGYERPFKDLVDTLCTWSAFFSKKGVNATQDEIIINTWNDHLNWMFTVGYDQDGTPLLGIYEAGSTAWIISLPWTRVEYGLGTITIAAPEILTESQSIIFLPKVTFKVSPSHTEHLKTFENLRLIQFTFSEFGNVTLSRKGPLLKQKDE